MIEKIMQFLLFCVSFFASITIAAYLLLMRNNRTFTTWAGIFLGFLAGSVAEFLKIIYGYNHFSVWILHAAGYLLVAVGFIHIYQYSRRIEKERQHRKRIASLIADTKTMVDPITRLANRRQFETRTQIEFQHAVEYHKSLSVLALRVDDFRGKYEEYGQVCADEILRSVALIISSTIRESPRGNDLAARTESDQFTILLVGADSAIARSVADRLLIQIQMNPLIWQNQYIHLNASIAYHSYPPSTALQPESQVASSSATQLILTVEDTLERACLKGPGNILQGPA